jgi:predicted phage-related endonuclease
LNAFIGKKYSLKIQENCSRVDECLRILCTKVAKQLFGKHGGSRQNLLANIKSIAVRHSELSTIALVNDLQGQVSQLQSVNMSITSENNLLSNKCKQASTLVSQFQKKIDKATVDIDKLKSENTKLYSVIEKLSPQRRFENQGKTFL